MTVLSVPLARAFVPRNRTTRTYPVNVRRPAKWNSGKRSFLSFAVGLPKDESDLSCGGIDRVEKRPEQCRWTMGGFGDVITVAIESSVHTFELETSLGEEKFTLQSIGRLSNALCPAQILDTKLLLGGTLAVVLLDGDDDSSVVLLVDTATGSLIDKVDLGVHFDKLQLCCGSGLDAAPATLVCYGQCSYLACVQLDRFRLHASEILYLDYWPTGALLVNSHYYYVVDPRGSYTIYRLHEGRFAETHKKVMSAPDTPLGDPSFGRIIQIAQDSTHSIVLQEMGWSLYETTGLAEIISSPLTSSFERFLQVSDSKGAILMTDGTIMCIDGPQVMLAPRKKLITALTLNNAVYGSLLLPDDTLALSKLVLKDNQLIWSDPVPIVAFTEPYRGPIKALNFTWKGKNVELDIRPTGVTIRKQGKIAEVHCYNLCHIHQLRQFLEFQSDDDDTPAIVFDIQTMNQVSGLPPYDSMQCRVIYSSGRVTEPTEVHYMNRAMRAVPLDYLHDTIPWMTIIEYDYSFLSNNPSAESLVILKQTGKDLPQLQMGHQLILRKLAKMVLGYNTKTSTLAWDALSDVLKDVANDTDLTFETFDFWYPLIDSPDDNEALYATLIIAVCSAHETEQFELFNPEVAQKILKELLSYFVSGDDRTRSLVLRAFQELKFKAFKHTIIDIVDWLQLVLSIWSSQSPGRETVSAAERYLNSLFSVDADCTIIMLTSILPSALQYINHLLLEKRTLLTASHLLLIFDALRHMQMPNDRGDLRQQMELLQSLLCSTKPISFDSDTGTLCIAIENATLQIGYFGVLWQKFSATNAAAAAAAEEIDAMTLASSVKPVYLKYPEDPKATDIEDNESQEDIKHRKLLIEQLGQPPKVIEPKLSDDGRYIVAFDPNTLSILLWAVDQSRLVPDTTTAAEVARNNRIAVKVPDFDLLFVQSYWNLNDLSDRFLHTKLSDVVAEMRPAGPGQALPASARIPVTPVLYNYSEIFSGITWKDVAVGWDNGLLVLTLRGSVIFTYSYN